MYITLSTLTYDFLNNLLNKKLISIANKILHILLPSTS